MNQISTITYPGGMGSKTVTYDPADNITEISYSDGTTHGFNYDALGRVISANNDGGPNTISRAYDKNGRLSNSNGIAVQRDLGGRIISLALASGKTISYTYDANDRVTHVSDWLGATTTFSYDSAGRMTGIDRPNGVDTLNTWDADGRLSAISHAGVSGNLATITVTHNANGQIVASERDLEGETSITAFAKVNAVSVDAALQIVGNSYDEVGRLTAAGPDSFSWDMASRLNQYTVNGDTVTASYDPSGRRLSRTQGGKNSHYVWNDALGISSISIERRGGEDYRYFVHNTAGDLLYSINADGNSRHFYHYDELGNTLLITDDAGVVLGTYTYAPYGEILSTTGVPDNLFTWLGRYGVMDEGNGLYYIRVRYYDSQNARFISRDPVELDTPRSVNPYQYALADPINHADPSGLGPEVRLPQLPNSYPNTFEKVDWEGPLDTHFFAEYAKGWKSDSVGIDIRRSWTFTRLHNELNDVKSFKRQWISHAWREAIIKVKRGLTKGTLQFSRLVTAEYSGDFINLDMMGRILHNFTLVAETRWTLWEGRIYFHRSTITGFDIFDAEGTSIGFLDTPFHPFSIQWQHKFKLPFVDPDKTTESGPAINKYLNDYNKLNGY